jgi:hypothetical protein
MMPARLRALALVIAILIGTAVAVAVIGREPRGLPPRPANERPALLLLTSLPIVFGEQFSLGDGGSPALEALSKRYRVLPIGVASAEELARGRLLLMAHPAAQPPEDLVALDDWVRRGGRLLLLADPLLEWPSSRPLGDPLRPSPMFPDTGLLAHWGLRLDTPDRRGRQPLRLAGYEVVTESPGRLAGRCEIGQDALVAHCRIGQGRATIVADADLLDARRLGDGARHNLDALIAELAELERN